MGRRPLLTLRLLRISRFGAASACAFSAVVVAALATAAAPPGASDLLAAGVGATAPASITSDEFSGSALDSTLWRVLDPLGDSSVSVASGRLRLSVAGAKRHDLWEAALEAPRVLQAVPDVDFEVEAKYDAAVKQGQMQGLVAQAGVGDLVRFDVHAAAGVTRLFAATFVAGRPTTRLMTSVKLSTPFYLRMKRAGSEWTLRYSSNGQSWTTAARFSFPLALNELGLFAGNFNSSSTSPPPAFTSRVDYFRVVSQSPPPPPPDTSAPLISGVQVNAATTAATVSWTTSEPADSVVEYGPTQAYEETRSLQELVTSHSMSLVDLNCGTTYHLRVSSADAAGNRASAVETFTTGSCAPPPDTTPPLITGAAVSTTATGATINWSTNEPADSRVQYGTSPTYGEEQGSAALVSEHDVTLSGLACETAYHLRVSSADASGNRATGEDRTFTTTACPPPPPAWVRGDEFDGSALDAAVWRLLDPLGDSSVSVGGGRLRMALPAGSGHDLWEGSMLAPRVLQAAGDGDFEIEAKFDSPVRLAYQSQGLVAQADFDDLVRFDVYSAGGEMRVFAATFVAGQATLRANAEIGGGAPVYLRLGRTGSVWTLRYSSTGSEWTTAASFSFPLTLREFGLFAGNPVTAPAFTAEVDYFRVLSDAASPPPPPDTAAPVISGVSASPVTTSATVTWSTDEPSDSRVEYGLSPAYGQVRSQPALVSNHSLELSGLACATSYHYRISSADAAGNRATGEDRTFTTTACPPPPPAWVRGDEFDGSALDTSVWRVVDPFGDVSISVGTGRLRVSLPAGRAHDLWEGALDAPRVLGAAADADFEIEAKYDSAVSETYQSQGLVAQADFDDLVRFDVYSSGGATRLFAATFVGGSPTVRLNETIQGGAPIYLRMQRSGSVWTLRYSLTGSSWTSAASFTFPLALREFGVFAGNPGPAPAFTAAVDHFRVLSEGQPPPPPPDDTTPPVLSAVAAAPGSTTATVTWTTNEPADSRVEYGPTTAYGQARSGSPLVTSHSISLSGLTCATTYHYRVSSADASGNRANGGDGTFTTGACVPSSGPTIEIWYGDSQRFGDPGIAQRWLNILGNAADADGLLRIDYRVDAGPRIDLVYDPQVNLRIGAYGDFNIELDRLALSAGGHVVTITAADRLGHESTRTVDLEVVSGLSWPLPYETNWAAGLQRTAQIVDGRWALDGDGVRSIVPGYDRTIAVGDETWTSVDATVPVRVHAFSASSDHAGVGIAAGWRGHEGSARPRGEWPLGALCFYYRHLPNEPYWLYLIQYGSPMFVDADPRMNWLEVGTQYVFRIRAEPVDGQQSRYSCKVWRAADPEPSEWHVSALLPRRSGSLLLVSDHADVTFGRVNARPAGS